MREEEEEAVTRVVEGKGEGKGEGLIQPQPLPGLALVVVVVVVVMVVVVVVVVVVGGITTRRYLSMTAIAGVPSKSPKCVPTHPTAGRQVAQQVR